MLEFSSYKSVDFLALVLFFFTCTVYWFLHTNAHMTEPVFPPWGRKETSTTSPTDHIHFCYIYLNQSSTFVGTSGYKQIRIIESICQLIYSKGQEETHFLSKRKEKTG